MHVSLKVIQPTSMIPGTVAYKMIYVVDDLKLNHVKETRIIPNFQPTQDIPYQNE